MRGAHGKRRRPPGGKENAENAPPPRRNRRRRRRPPDNRVHPAEQKSPRGTKSSPQVSVLAAGLRNRRAQLRIGKRAEQRKNRPHNPRREHHGNKTPLPRHLRRFQKNPRPNHRANTNRAITPSPQPPHQFQSFLAHLCLFYSFDITIKRRCHPEDIRFGCPKDIKVNPSTNSSPRNLQPHTMFTDRPR